MLISENFNIPVLLIIFNRLDTTKQIIGLLQQIKPNKLFIAADGPRNTIDGEKNNCDIVRNFVLKNINWNCDINTLFRNENFGCGKNPAEAISWFFDQVDMGIILEDDCLPSLSFFPYCKELLIKYKDEEKIYHIAGNNPLTITKTIKNYSYYFTFIQHCWGWASWKRAWSHYSFQIMNFDEFCHKEKLKSIFKQKAAHDYWYNIFKEISEHEIDAWDYQWTYAIFNNNGICINPAYNLITNIGFGSDSTHTNNSNSVFNNQKRFEIEKIIHPKEIKIYTSLIKKVNKISFGITDYSYYKSKIKKSIKRILPLS